VNPTAAVSRDSLKDLIDRALLDANYPHVDLGPLLGVDIAVRVGIDDVLPLLNTEEPAFRLELGDGKAITVRRQDGGMMATVEVKW
jgi:hypothetical protein